MHHVEHGAGRPVIVPHGTGVDHREAEACVEPTLAGAGLRRIYPDLPSMGCSRAPDSMRSVADVLDMLVAFAGGVTDGSYLLVGHSVGGYDAPRFR